jgi:uncharacterized protein (DUF1697 family)
MPASSRRRSAPAADAAGARGSSARAHVVVLRAVNVGGHGVLKTSEIPGRVPEWTVTTIGAAGTFAVLGAGSAADVRRRFAEATGLTSGVIVRTAAEFRELWTQRPTAWSGGAPEERRYVSFLAENPTKSPRIPHSVPSEPGWQVRLDAVVGLNVLSSGYRRSSSRVFYPNEVVEREFGVPATTRGWETLEKVASRLPSE